MNDRRPMIELRNITKIYEINGQEEIIIDRIDLKVEEREIFGLVGETGSGKSTILRMMTGFIEPEEGEIFLMGQKLDHGSKHELVRHTSMIFQSFNLLGNLSVLENVLLPCRLRQRIDRSSEARARELLDFVGLTSHVEAEIRTLSGGQKQRVAIARALMIQPKVIFCDEPTSALDERMSGEILTLLKHINQRFGTTIVLVSHDISVIKALCDRVAVIEQGRIEAVHQLAPGEIRPITYQEAFGDA